MSNDAEGTLRWDADVVANEQLRARLEGAARGTAAPEVHLRGDKATRYERIAFVMSAAQQAGLTRIGFVTEPAASPTTPAGK